VTAVALFWLAARPPIRLEETQFSIGERTIAWREVREINSSRFVSPLILSMKLTNSRHKLLIYPGEPERINSLLIQLRKKSHLATFDGVAHRDYWTWSSLINRSNENPAIEHPVRMLSTEEEEEIERLYQKLKTVGRLDSRGTDSSNTSPED
jgi:hypothetical protein